MAMNLKSRKKSNPCKEHQGNPRECNEGTTGYPKITGFQECFHQWQQRWIKHAASEGNYFE